MSSCLVARAWLNIPTTPQDMPEEVNSEDENDENAKGDDVTRDHEKQGAEEARQKSMRAAWHGSGVCVCVCF